MDGMKVAKSEQDPIENQLDTGNDRRKSKAGPCPRPETVENGSATAPGWPVGTVDGKMIHDYERLP